MSSATEQGNPGADPHPRDRLTAGYFPESSAGDPNRADAGPVHSIGPNATDVLTLLVPGGVRGVVHLRMVAVRTGVYAPPVQGLVLDFILAISRDDDATPPSWIRRSPTCST